MMTDMKLLLYIAVMAGVTYLVRMLPFVIFRRKITSPFIKSVLYYMPYAVLTAMTIPAVFTSAGGDMNGIIASLAGVIIAVLLAIKKASLLTVAAAACVAVYVVGKVLTLI
jgi:branched-subunit amino acid transport protein